MSDRLAAHAALLESLGAEIARRRRAKGLLQEDVSLRCGFNRAYLSVIEHGQRNPTVLTVAKIAEVLECKVSDLFKGGGH
ncbi:MAG TPA: helix-turn-helix transcriptional regulator [Acidimicrobiales bacterium]|nr:helix-turn-helix transcriptional regulator [Acidimicrobiales bacterium]